MKKSLFSVALLIAAAVSLCASAASAALFTLHIGSPVGTPTCGSVSIVNSSVPISRDLTCSATVPGLLSAEAAALFGHVGADSHASVGAGFFGSGFGVAAQSQFSDTVIFTSTDPMATSVLMAANLAFSGTLNATAAAGASVDVSYSMGGVGTLFFSATDNGVDRNDFNVAQGSVSSTVNNALLRTNMFVVPLNTPIPITMSLSTSAGVSGSGSPESGRAEFSNSFEVPFGIDAFVLPEGVTANSGDWLVDNRRVGELSAIPEPASCAAMIIGLGMIGCAMRGRGRGRRNKAIQA